MLDIADSVMEKRRFLLCAWNELEIENEVSEGEDYNVKWIFDSMTKTVACYLEAMGWQNVLNLDPYNTSSEGFDQRVADCEGNADLVVVVPRNRDKPFSFEDLTVFHAGLGGDKPKKVLYIHIGGHSAFAQGRLSNWLFRISRADGNTDEIKKWLDELPEPIFSSYTWKPDELEKYNEKWAIEDKKWPSRTGRRLIESGSRAQFFFGLCRLSSRFNRLEHDLNASRNQNDNGSVAELNFAKKTFLDKYFDLHSAIIGQCVAITFHNDLDNVPFQFGRNVVLLIDDHPESYQFDRKVCEVLEMFLPEMEFWVWNPEQSNGVDGYFYQNDIEFYSSWAQIDTQEKKLFVCQWLGEKGEKRVFGKKVDLIELLARTRIVLVDVLFQNAAGDDTEGGFGIIRGVQRICHDLQPDIKTFIRKILKENGEGHENVNWHLPGIIAISRASDLEKVQKAYRYSVSGYVLKERLLGLPLTIACNLRANFDPTGTSHRNFRLLYNLPHEMVGLLRSTFIPPIPFHRPITTVDFEPGSKLNKTFKVLSSCFERQRVRGRSLSKLIACLPKTDLHVHPGSCMSPEFLILASLIMLLRHEYTNQDDFIVFSDQANNLMKFWDGSNKEFYLLKDMSVENPSNLERRQVPFDWSLKGIAGSAQWFRKYIHNQIFVGEKNRRAQDPNPVIERRYLRFRSILHKGLKLSDYKNKKELFDIIEGIQDAIIFFFILTHGGPKGEPTVKDKNDVLRLFLIWLGSKYHHAKLTVRTGNFHKEFDLHDLFFNNITFDDWGRLHGLFYDDDGNENWSLVRLKKRHWDIDNIKSSIECGICLKRNNIQDNYLTNAPSRETDPIAWLVASGTRSTNLREYLEGCEFAGAEHLQHPFLMHLFAQQTVHQFVQQGILYAELRAAISGFSNEELGFSFSDACHCFCAAFRCAQQELQSQYHCRGKRIKQSIWLWNSSFRLENLFSPFASDLTSYRFPCKVSVILTGKRHKPNRLLLREAGAGAVLFSRPMEPSGTAKMFVKKVIPECRIVGFDLAGQEDGYPPHNFQTEYQQIARMHIPITVHAGENADVTFVESAILDLRARRLGHGLSLMDDRQLMDRARDEGVCIELCPVSNFQTNAIAPYRGTRTGREYPLRKFLNAGINVCLNTDNPIISNTNIVKECFQASYAYGKPGLSLWELLKILRLGFTQSFLTFPERRSLIELADQLVFDIFSRDDVATFLRSLPPKSTV